MPSKRSAQKRALPIIRVFVSSTFSDLKHERNALHAKVWPELERYCQQRGFTFQAIDLRWGVPSEAGLDHRTMHICFEELRRAQQTSPEPNFLILLGNRYGWRPLPEVISVEEFEKLKEAAQKIQNEPPDLTRKPSLSQVELLEKAVSVLEDWYLLDENARPFGDKTLPGEYVIRTRKTLLRDVNYGKEPDAEGKLQDTTAWTDVQFVLWSIVNRAFPAGKFAERFAGLQNAGPRTVPSIVRFQASATEQEIWHGAFDVENPDRHVIAAIREIENLDEIPHTSRRGDFIDLKDDGTPDNDATAALTKLKAEVEGLLSNSTVIRSTCQWESDENGKSTGDITKSHLDKFCDDILERFKSIIIKQINVYWDCDLSADNATLAQVRGSKRELFLECADHLRFARERAPKDSFVGREPELQRIRDYLYSDTNQPFVVHGPSGSGKTALLGRIIQQVTPPQSEDSTREESEPIVLSRFIGTTPDSSNLRSLISSLCRELRQDFEITKPLPTDLNKLIDEFYSQLGHATAARPIFVFLDALDQIDAADHGRSVFWIRSPLSSTADAACHSRMVASCLSPSEEFPEDSDTCEPFRALQRRKLLDNHELGALDEKDARLLFGKWLYEAGRSLYEPQQEIVWSAIAKSSGCRQPLFLKILFEETRLWPSYGTDVRLNELDMSNDYVRTLIMQMFDLLSLEANHGGMLVQCVIGYITAARYGLSEAEILEVLYADPDYRQHLYETSERNNHQLPTASNRIPIAIWSRLRSDLAPYLSERSAPGGNVLYFYHRQISNFGRQRFAGTPALRCQWHLRLVQYFARKHWWLESREKQRKRIRPPYSARPANVRKVTELPDQLFTLAHEFKSAGLRVETERTCKWIDRLLRSLTFLESKNEAGLVFDLQNDLRNAANVFAKDDVRVRILKLLDEAVRREIHFIYRHHQDYPQALFQCVWNLAWWYDCPDAAQHYESVAAVNKNVGDGVYHLLERWRDQREKLMPDFIWLRSLRPPDIRLGAGLLLNMRGHDEPVVSVAYSPDGNQIVSSTNDSVRIWDAETGAELKVLQSCTSNTGAVKVVYSSDGHKIVRKSANDLDPAKYEVKAWDAISGVELEVLSHHDFTNRLGCSPDGRQILTRESNDTVQVWDSQTRTKLYALRGHEHYVNCFSYSPDGCQVATGSKDHTVRVWDAETGAEVNVFRGHHDPVESVSYSPDGTKIVSGSRDSTMRMWDATTGTELAVVLADYWFMSVAFSPDGKRVVSGGTDAAVRLWDANTGAELKVLRGHANRHVVLCVAYSPNGRWIVSGSNDLTVRVWDAESGHELKVLDGHEYRVQSVEYSSDCSRIVSRSSDTWRVWDAETGAELSLLRGHEGIDSNVAFSPDRCRFVSRGTGHSVQVWDTEKRDELPILRRNNHRTTSLAISPDGCRVVSGSEDGILRVSDAVTGTVLSVLRSHDAYIHSVAYSPDGRRIVSGSGDRTVRVWDAISGAELCVLQGHRYSVDCVAFSPDCRWIASCSCDGPFQPYVRVWDSEARICWLQPMVEGISSVAFSPDGRRGVCGSITGYVSVFKVPTIRKHPLRRCVDIIRKLLQRRSWELRILETTLRLDGRLERVRCISFTRNGGQIIVGDNDSVCVYDVWNGKLLNETQYSGICVKIVGFSLVGIATPNETLIRLIGSDSPIAWFPAPFAMIDATTDGRVWAGPNGVFHVEGAMEQ